MTQYIILQNDDQPVARTTIADAIDVLQVNTRFGDSDNATIRVGGIRLPSGQAAGLVCVTFKGQSGSEAFIVRLRSANYFQAFEQGVQGKRVFEIELLDGATVDGRGNTVLSNGRRIRAVEVIPELLPYELTDLDLRIVHLTISMIGAEDRCYRSLRSGVPEAHQEALPDHRFLDFSTFLPTGGWPPPKIPLLKQIKGER